MIIDTSALLAILFNEKEGPWVAKQLEENSFDLQMSTVNLAELLMKIQNRQPQLFEHLRELVATFNIRYIPLSEMQATIAGRARSLYPVLNFGDCFVYALAKSTGGEIITLDNDFKKTDIKILMP